MLLLPLLTRDSIRAKPTGDQLCRVRPTSTAAPSFETHKYNAQISRRRLLTTLTAAVAHLFASSLKPSTVEASDVASAPQQCPFDDLGPFEPIWLPQLEHICDACFPLCVGDRCLIRIQVVYPKSNSPGSQAPYPLAIISGGFLVKGEAYRSYAERLASWGYVTVLYDKVETLTESLDDVVSTSVIREIIDWASINPLMQRISDTEAVYLIGHSRGGKLSVLTAASDQRVRSLCLIDPVDNTVYAPLGPGYPSAVEALKSNSVSVPIMAVGSELGTDCAPIDANFKKFYEAARGSAMEIVIRDSGHFQFLDSASTLTRALCLQGATADAEVRATTQSLMVAWGEVTIKPFVRPRSPNDPVQSIAAVHAFRSTSQPPRRGAPGSSVDGLESLLRGAELVIERDKNLPFTLSP